MIATLLRFGMEAGYLSREFTAKPCRPYGASYHPFLMRVQVLDWNADGRGRAPLGPSKVALISQAYPGDRVSLRTDFATKGTVQGRVAELYEAGLKRIPHECRHEFHCTGCPFLALGPEDEAKFKLARVHAALSALPSTAGNLEPEPLLAPGGLFGYRHLAKQVFGKREGRTILGSFVTGTHRVADNWKCPIHAPALQALIDGVAETAHDLRLTLDDGPGRPGLRHVQARLSRATGELLLVVATTEEDPTSAISLCRELRNARKRLVSTHVLKQSGGGNALLAGDLVFKDGKDAIHEEVLGFRHAIGPRSFFQVNPAAAEVLFRRALEFAGEGRAVLEGYAGVGALTLPLTRQFQHTAAVESNREAADALKAGANAASVSVEVHAAEVEQAFTAILPALRPEVVLLDPPRAGAGERVMSLIAESSAERCVLMACDPAVLTRDLAPLVARGFRVERVLPVDQFPRTAHVEALVLLTRVRS